MRSVAIHDSQTHFTVNTYGRRALRTRDYADRRSHRCGHRRHRQPPFMIMDTITTNGTLAEVLGAERPEAATAAKRATYDGRFYGPLMIDNVPRYYPSVTTILGDVKVGYGFEAWGKEQAANLGVEGARLDMALRAEDGTLVHEAIERYNKGETLLWADYPGKRNDDKTWKCINRYVQWLNATKPELLATELTVYSKEFEFAGTCDAIIRLDGKIMVLDYKTSKQINPTHELQVAAYAHAVREMFPQLLEHSIDGQIGAAVLALDTRHKAGYHFLIVDDQKKKWTDFVHRLIVFRDAHPDFNPKLDVLPEVLVPTHTLGGLLECQ